MAEKSKIIKGVVAGVGALAIIGGAFAGGYVTRLFTQPALPSSLEWLLGKIRDNYYFDYDEQDLAELSFKELVASLGDRYSVYYTAEEYNSTSQSNAGSRSGWGFLYDYVDGVGICITSVTGNSPARKAGVRVGDIVLSGERNGERTEFPSRAAFTEFLDSCEDGEEITLEISGKPPVTLAPSAYTASYAAMYTSEYCYEFTDGRLVKNSADAIDYMPDNTAYITLSQFYGAAADEMGRLIGEFDALGADSLILDLRGNGGGFNDVMSQIAGRFTSALGGSRTAMIQRNKRGAETVTLCSMYYSSFLPKGTEVYIMADSSTASASEALIGVLVSYNISSYPHIFLSDYGLGAPVKTFGKGIMQTTYVNPRTGEAVKLTTAGIFWPNGTTVHGRGILPDDGCNVVSASSYVAPGDEELRQVVEKILSEKT